MALRFIDRREPLATAALGHVLAQSSTCRKALAELVPGQLPEGLTYRSELADQLADGRPDVVGAMLGQRHIIVEGKFWAGLTEAQPVAYLRTLVEQGTLVVVAPHLRFPTIGAELLRLVAEQGLCVDGHLQIDDATGAEARFVRVGDRHLGLVSWRLLLSRLRQALLDAGDTALAADVDQLDGLCALEDDEAFLPLSSVDLSHPTPLRIYQYMQLVDTIVQRAVAA